MCVKFEFEKLPLIKCRYWKTMVTKDDNKYVLNWGKDFQFETFSDRTKGKCLHIYIW